MANIGNYLGFMVFTSFLMLKILKGMDDEILIPFGLMWYVFCGIIFCIAFVIAIIAAGSIQQNNEKQTSNLIYKAINNTMDGTLITHVKLFCDISILLCDIFCTFFWALTVTCGVWVYVPFLKAGERRSTLFTPNCCTPHLCKLVCEKGILAISLFLGRG